MKKILAICLLLMLTISLTACSAINNIITPTATPTPTPTATPSPTPTPTVVPLSNHYDTAEELVADLLKINNYPKMLDALSKNTDVHHFFSQSEAGNRIWELIWTESNYGLSYHNIYGMYAVCNGNSRWFDALNIYGQPFAIYGATTEYASSAIPSKDSIINQIKNKFKDPYSVSIPGDMLLFPPNPTNDLMYPTPLEFGMWVGVRATNSFGAYGMEGIWLKVSNGKVTFYDSIAVDSEPKECSLRGFENTFPIRISK